MRKLVSFLFEVIFRVGFLIISLDSIKFAPQAVEEDQDIKRLNKEYHTNYANIPRSA